MAIRLLLFIYSRDGSSEYCPCGTWECYRIKEQRRIVASCIYAKIIGTGFDNEVD